MELNIGKRLRKLRKERNLTQEEVAKHLGISFQAISKWECNEGYPDITMLPVLANYFNVSVDTIIGMEEISSSQKLEEINQKWEKNRQNGKHVENVVLMRNALKIYPNNPLLLVQLSASLERLEGTQTEKQEYLRQSIEVQEQIIQYCADSEIRGAVLFNIADSYFRYNDYEKAIEYARKLPNVYKCRENALVHILKDKKQKHDIAKEALESLTWVIAFHLKAVAETEENMDYKKKMTQIIDIIFEGNESDFIKKIRTDMIS